MIMEPVAQESRRVSSFLYHRTIYENG